MTSAALARHPLVPEFVLRPFADEAGRVLKERRDRARRATARVEEVMADLGTYRVTAGAPAGAATLDGLLGEAVERAAQVAEAARAGRFPPTGDDRAALALFLGLQLLVGRGHRHRTREAATALATAVDSAFAALEELEELEDDDGEEAASAEAPAARSAAFPEAAGGDPGALLVEDGEAVPVDLAGLPRLAQALVGRTWQLVRFPGRALLTGDTPVVLWGRAAGGRGDLTGLATADEVRFPLDPRHALVLARQARAGEVIRDLDDRHARALNRTVAETARRWVYCHPASDPLGGIELAPA